MVKIKKSIDFIASRRFAVWLMLLTVSLILLSKQVPEPEYMAADELEQFKSTSPLLYKVSEKISPDKLAKSAAFQLIPVFIFLSITACTFKRIKKNFVQSEKKNVLPESFEPIVASTFRADSKWIELVDDSLRKKGWDVSSFEAEGKIAACRGREGIWGSFIFHVGMNIVLVGILISVSFGFTGILFLTEGFDTSVPEDIRGQEGIRPEKFPFKILNMKKFSASYQNRDRPTDFGAEVYAIDLQGEVSSHFLAPNRPLVQGAYKFIFVEAGYAPHFRLKDKTGKVLLDAVTRMKLFMPGMEDRVNFADEALEVKVELFPDFYREEGVPMTRSKYPLNPVIFVEISKWDKVVGRGFIKVGESVDFDEYQLEFPELSHWVRLAVDRDRGVGVIAFGFFMVCIGLALRFVLNDEYLWITLKSQPDGDRLEVGGRSGYFPALFREKVKKLAPGIFTMAEGIKLDKVNIDD